MRRLSYIGGCWLFGIATAFGAASFDKLLVFSGADNVRISAVFSPGDKAAVWDFSGRIVPANGGAALWQGSLGTNLAAAPITISNRITGLAPKVWSPATPVLYRFEIEALEQGKRVAAKSVRFGFRSFEVRQGQFWLNGRPIFLRGLAINPPGRGIPAAVGETRRFAEEYVRFLKSQNLNIFRISTDESQTWFDVCDELGMMMYAGRYGAPPESDEGKQTPPKDFGKAIAGYKKLFESYASHPSIVEYYLANELPVSGARGAAFSRFLTGACAELKQWDDTRAYIGNAGYGEGREGDVCDVHRYWGWYYNSFLTYYNLRDRLFPKPLFGDPAKNQPLTFTECVGSFTGSSGQFNLVRSKQLAPALGWIGHSGNPQADALEYQSFMVKQACESFRCMRPLNPRLAGLMPFTILFREWTGISSFSQMQPKPAAEAMRLAYQPVLLSWENWTPQLYAGAEFRPIAHVINDDDLGRELHNGRLEFELRGVDGRQYWKGATALPTIPYYGTWSQAIPIELPKDLKTGTYRLQGRITVAGEERSTNFTRLFVADASWQSRILSEQAGKPVYLYDPPGTTAAALRKLGIPFQPLPSDAAWPPSAQTLILGEGAWNDALGKKKDQLQKFIREGGRIVCLRPDPETFDATWLPCKITFLKGSPNDTDYPPRSRPFREQMNVNLERPTHAVFRGLAREQFSLWSDYTGWDQSKPGFPSVYPVTAGFQLEGPEALARAAVLADYDRGLEGIALCELFEGRGSVLLCGLDLARRAGLDPVADRVLANLVSYSKSTAGHDIYPLIEQTIRWGDYPSECGLVCGSLNGLLVNAEWVPSPLDRQPKPPNTGSWNMAPGEQFEPRGRNPFGRFGYSTAASLRDLNRETQTGEGFFQARVPSGRADLLTTVKNPGLSIAPFKVYLQENGEPASAISIAPGATVQVRTPIALTDGTIRVRYWGDKSLVLLETEFR